MYPTHQFKNNICAYCRTSHRSGELYCTFCGKALFKNEQTKPIRQPRFYDMLISVESDAWSLPAYKPLKIHVIEDTSAVIIQTKSELILGCSTLLGKDVCTVDIDFIHFDGFAKGVSRIHALIRRESDFVYLIDQASKNGTHLNGIRLIAYEPYSIKNGDVAYLGSLSIRFDFS